MIDFSNLKRMKTAGTSVLIGQPDRGEPREVGSFICLFVGKCNELSSYIKDAIRDCNNYIINKVID